MRWAIWCGVSLTRYMLVQASRLGSEYTNKAGNPVAVGPSGLRRDVARSGRFRCGQVGLGVLRQGEDCKRQYGGLRPSLLLFREQMRHGLAGRGLAWHGRAGRGLARTGKDCEAQV